MLINNNKGSCLSNHLLNKSCSNFTLTLKPNFSIYEIVCKISYNSLIDLIFFLPGMYDSLHTNIVKRLGIEIKINLCFTFNWHGPVFVLINVCWILLLTLLRSCYCAHHLYVYKYIYVHIIYKYLNTIWAKLIGKKNL